MGRNHPLRQHDRTQRSVQRAFESADEAGFSSVCIQTTFLVFLGLTLLIMLLI